MLHILVLELLFNCQKKYKNLTRIIIGTRLRSKELQFGVYSPYIKLEKKIQHLSLTIVIRNKNHLKQWPLEGIQPLGRAVGSLRGNIGTIAHCKNLMWSRGYPIS